MVKSRSRIGQEREEPEKKPKLSPMTTSSGSRSGEEREVPERKTKMGRGRSRSGAANKSKLRVVGRGGWRTWPANKTKLSMDPVVSVGSSTKGALEGIPRTVVCFRYSHPEAEVHRFGPKLAEFGKILRGPFNLPFLHDFAYVQYSAQDAADKALQQPVEIPGLGVDLICHNINDTVLDAVRRAACNLVEPHVLPHPANTLVYVSNVPCDAPLDQIRAAFSQFGEIAKDPIWFEMEPESQFGFTLLVYKTEEGAKVAVQQPHKFFEFHQVHCSRNLDAIIQFYQGKFVDYLEAFAVNHQLPPPLRQPLGGANTCAFFSVDSSTKAALEIIPRTMVCFRYSHREEFQCFRHKLAEFGRILMGPFSLPFLHDFAYVHYSAQDEADKALQQPVQIPGLGVELICRNIDHTDLDAVRQAACNLVEPHVLPHPANTLVYVSNVSCDASLDQIWVFFSRFGEIAEGPIWFGMEEESEFGFTLLVYKTEEGAKAAIQQPHKYVGGHQVHCSCDLDAIIHLYQGQFVYYLQTFADYNIKHQLPPPKPRGDAKRLMIW